MVDKGMNGDSDTGKRDTDTGIRDTGHSLLPFLSTQ